MICIRWYCLLQQPACPLCFLRPLTAKELVQVWDPVVIRRLTRGKEKKFSPSQASWSVLSQPQHTVQSILVLLHANGEGKDWAVSYPSTDKPTTTTPLLSSIFRLLLKCLSFHCREKGVNWRNKHPIWLAPLTEVANSFALGVSFNDSSRNRWFTVFPRLPLILEMFPSLHWPFSQKLKQVNNKLTSAELSMPNWQEVPQGRQMLQSCLK